MKRCWMVLLALLFIAGTSGRALADNAAILKRDPVDEGGRIEERRAEAGRAGVAGRDGRGPTRRKTSRDGNRRGAVEERFGTLEIHGGAVLYYQGLAGVTS
ncbi:MAG: hypothetical protein MZV70_29700 [Desulfobacterales bacterium]|nr:hypothetical protein [Desulfobacterales bacterium]